MGTSQQPWLANPDWARKRIPGTTSPNIEAVRWGWLSCVFAILLGFVGLALRGKDSWGHHSFFILLIFPSVGLALLGRNLLLLTRSRNFQDSYFEMDSLPFYLGQNVAGTVHIPIKSRRDIPVRISLNCVRRTKSISRGLTGRSKITWDQLVWRDEQIATNTSTQKEISLPVTFAIPADAPSTDSANPDDRILWVLRVSAKLRGVNLLQYFELPVFSNPNATPRPAYGDRDFYAAIPVSLPTHAPAGRPQVIIRTAAGGGTEFLFLANRHRRVAIFATVAFGAWTMAIRYFFWGSDALSLAFFLLGDFLLLHWAMWAWFSRASAIFQNGTVTLRNSILGLGKSKSIAYRDIRKVTSPITSESGQGADAIPAYALYLETSSQGTVTVASGLRNSREAGYVAGKIREEIRK